MDCSDSEDSDPGSQGSAEDELPMCNVIDDQLHRDSGNDEHFVLLQPDAVYAEMLHIIEQVYQIVQLPTRVLRLLLSQYRWDKDLLLERFYEREQEEFLKRHNVPASQWKQRRGAAWLRLESGHQQQLKRFECQICCELRAAQEMIGSPCNHFFCTECYRAYIVLKMRGEGQFDKIECAAYSCRVLLEDEAILELLCDSSRLRAQFQRSLVTSFVTCNRRMAFCPGAGCELVAKLSDDFACAGRACRVTCKCGHSFCFACRQDWHEPISCAMLKRWNHKNEGESMSTQWFMANTKECPSCHATIEKNGGCNHMKCRNTACNYEFCWVCMGEWQPHGKEWYNCNRFDEARAERVREQQALSRNFLARYLHYYDLYMNHLKSLEFEAKLQDTVNGKMEEMQQHGLSWVEVKFLHDAAAVLCHCRRVLMYTYVFAYYLRPSNQQKIFEDNQRNLQLATESLSEVLEHDLDVSDVAKLKQSVQDRLRYCESRSSALLDHVYEGYQKDMWDFEANEGIRLNLNNR